MCISWETCRYILVTCAKGRKAIQFTSLLVSACLLTLWQWRAWHNWKCCVKGYTLHRTPLNELMLRELLNAFQQILIMFHNANTFWTMHQLLMHWWWLVQACWSNWQITTYLCSFVLTLVIFLLLADIYVIIIVKICIIGFYPMWKLKFGIYLLLYVWNKMFE